MTYKIALPIMITCLAIAFIGEPGASGESRRTAGARSRLTPEEADQVRGGVLADIALPVENARSRTDDVRFAVSLNSSVSSTPIELYAGSTKVSFNGLTGGVQQWNERVPWPVNGPTDLSMIYLRDGQWYPVAGSDPTRQSVGVHPDVKVYGIYFHNLRPGHLTADELESIVDNRDFTRDWTVTPSLDERFAAHCAGNEIVQFRFMGMEEHHIEVTDSHGHTIDCADLHVALTQHDSGGDDGYDRCIQEIGELAFGNLVSPNPPGPNDPDHPNQDLDHPRHFLHVFNIDSIPHPQSQRGKFMPTTFLGPESGNVVAGMIFVTRSGVPDYVGTYSTVLGHEIMHHYGGHCGEGGQTSCDCSDCGANCQSNGDMTTNILCDQGGRELEPAQCLQLAQTGLPYRNLNAPPVWGW